MTLPNKCTVAEIAKRFRYSKKTVYERLKSTNTLPLTETRGRARLFDSSEIEKIFKEEKTRNIKCFYYYKCLTKAARADTDLVCSVCEVKKKEIK